MRVVDVLLRMPTDMCSGASQQYCGIDPPRDMESDLRPFTIVS